MNLAIEIEITINRVISYLGFDPRPLIARAIERGWVSLPDPTPPDPWAQREPLGEIPADDDALVIGAKQAASLIGVSETWLRAQNRQIHLGPHRLAWRAGDLRAIQARRASAPHAKS
jgi:hypothetical protein